MTNKLPNKTNTCAIVVWYHPSEKEKEAVRLYENEVAHVIVVDNTENNIGIAAALNRGCEQAQEMGATWVLTMDQDSLWNQQTVGEYMAEVAQYAQAEQVGVFSPFQDSDGQVNKHHRQGRFEQREAVMCSGNLVRLEAWKAAKGWREDFFIDLVDDEFCCHVRKMGWQVVRCNHILLSHTLGEGAQALKHTRHLYTAHAPWRYYYIGRNLHRMTALYPEHKRSYRKKFWKECKRLCLYDHQQAFQKINNLLKGWIEWKKD